MTSNEIMQLIPLSFVLVVAAIGLWSCYTLDANSENKKDNPKNKANN